MLHSLVVLIDMLAIFLVKSLFLSGISVSQNVPATMAPGEEVKVIIEVDKGSLSGFAKLQLDVPQGLTVEAIDTKGASFTFADQKAKYIWMALPSQQTFKISYNLKADANASGTKEIRGTLSYIEDNERRHHDLPVSIVRLGTAGEIADGSPDMAGEPLVTAGSGAPLDAVVENVALVPSQPGQGGVTTQRTISPVTTDEFLVEVRVNKGAIRGFGKLEETIPQGFSALEKNSEDAIVTMQDRVVKFVWLNLPAKDELKIVYKLRTNGQPHGSYAINGSFGYLLQDETQRTIVGTTTFEVGGDLAQTEEPEEETKEQPPVTPPTVVPPPTPAPVPPTPAPTPTPKPTPVPKPGPDKEAAPPTAGTSRIPAPETGVTYKVQITAGKREVSASYFPQRHRYTGAVDMERHQGWVKYTAGRFNNYRQARDQRVAFVSAGHGFPGPFVTAYNDGARITVQEALMISQQKWVP